MANTLLVELSSTVYTDLGALPVIVEHFGGPKVFLSVAATVPSAATYGHVLNPSVPDAEPSSVMLTPITTGDTRHAWGRSYGEPSGTSHVIVTGVP